MGHKHFIEPKIISASPPLSQQIAFTIVCQPPHDFGGEINSQSTEAAEENKGHNRHQMLSLLMAHTSREVLSKFERAELRKLKAEKDLFIAPMDKGRSTVVVVVDSTD
ncbi:unnamed protein product [Schistocephalus solidus]|uniref:Uncharacterized protein n=1 Tax=Schistocephalus solidus TaxID=70667 RepID=A0A183T302_SCHSO|nr:unnamed protein product [Schistocephalus solidus]